MDLGLRGEASQSRFGSTAWLEEEEALLHVTLFRASVIHTSQMEIFKRGSSSAAETAERELHSFRHERIVTARLQESRGLFKSLHLFLRCKTTETKRGFVEGVDWIAMHCALPELLRANFGKAAFGQVGMRNEGRDG